MFDALDVVKVVKVVSDELLGFLQHTLQLIRRYLVTLRALIRLANHRHRLWPPTALIIINTFVLEQSNDSAEEDVDCLFILYYF